MGWRTVSAAKQGLKKSFWGKDGEVINNAT